MADHHLDINFGPIPKRSTEQAFLILREVVGWPI